MCCQSTGVSAGNAMTSLLNKCKCKRTSVNKHGVSFSKLSTFLCFVMPVLSFSRA